MNNTGTGGTFNVGTGEQHASPNAFGKKKLLIRKSFLKELIQTELRNFKK